MEAKKKNISFYEREVNEVLGAPPPSLLVTANSIIFLIVTCLILYGLFVKYPVTYQSELTVPSDLYPDTIVVKSEHLIQKIDSVLVNDRHRVLKGEDVFRYFDEDSNVKYVKAADDGFFVALNSMDVGSMIDVNENMYCLVRKKIADEFYMKVTGDNLNYLKIGTEVTILPNADQAAVKASIVRLIYDEDKNLLAKIKPIENNGGISMTNTDFVGRITIEHRSLFGQLFSNLLNK